MLRLVKVYLMEVFNQAWSLLRDNFYDANFHGANWNAVRAEYEPRIAGARNGDEMRRLIRPYLETSDEM